MVSEIIEEKGPHTKGRGHITSILRETDGDARSPMDFGPDYNDATHQLAEETGATRIVENEKGSMIPDVQTAEGIVSNVLTADDDPTLGAWTFRTWFLGIGIAIFGSVLAEIYQFKPQGVAVNGIFLLMISYILGEAMSTLIPRRGYFKYLNPYPFNAKEHACIQIMASSGSAAAQGTEVLSVQRLFYNTRINAGTGIFMLFASQLLGYGLVGVLRKILIYPTNMFYPQQLPLASTIQTLHRDKHEVKSKLRVFYIGFAVLFFWELLPEYMFMLLIGLSIPCLAAPNNSVVSRLFGGTNGNEGLGFLSISFDWNYIAGENPMAVPLVASVNYLFGYFLCIIVYMGVYYSNLWDAQNFPFLTQELYYGNSTQGNYFVYNQTAILDSNNHLNETALAIEGIPYMATTYVIYLMATNLSISATFTWMYLFHWDTMKPAFTWMMPSSIKAMCTKENLKFWASHGDDRLNRDGSIPDTCHDPHFKAMLAYKEAPQWWYFGVLAVSFVTGMVCLYVADSGLPWWAFIVAIILAYVFILFLGGLVALFGFGGTQMQAVIQLIGGYIHPGNPMANMYFTLYGYNSVQQAFVLLKDLKLAYYVKLSPRSTFTSQIVGTLIGCIFNYIMMNSIIDAQAPILKSIEGTAVWSGQSVQSYNTQGIAWGALAKYIFSATDRYQFVPIGLAIGLFCPVPFYILHRILPRWGFDLVNIPLLVWHMGWLVVGINSAISSFFVVAFLSQWYVRKYHPILFTKYNYLLAAGMIGGTQVMVFILAFATQGAAGSSHVFPTWWGNNNFDADGNPQNFDHCLYVD